MRYRAVRRMVYQFRFIFIAGLLLLALYFHKLRQVNVVRSRTPSYKKASSILLVNAPIDPTVEKAISSYDDPSYKDNIFHHFSSDNHLKSLLARQANPNGQVLVTTVGGDAYSLFAWDWYERMLELSNDTDNCHCFVIAIDEIDLVLAVRQGIPVYYSTFSFKDQLLWRNVIEARKHLLYRDGHAKFQTSAKILQMGYAVLMSEMDVFWAANPVDQLKQPVDKYDLQISDHAGSHARINIGIFFARPTVASSTFFANLSQFWIRHGKGALISDQRVLDAMLYNYDRLHPTYRRLTGEISSSPLNWTTHFFGHQVSHMMIRGSAFYVFNQAARLGLRSKKFYGGLKGKYFTATINKSMEINERSLLLRALLILQQSHLLNRTLILPAFMDNLTSTPLSSQLDIKKFFLHWTDERVRLPEFLSFARNRSIPIVSISLSLSRNYEDVDGILDISLHSIPFNLSAPTPEFDASVRDSIFWCSPPAAADGWCKHNLRDFDGTAELLFACADGSDPPCHNE